MKPWTPFLMACCGLFLLLGIGKLSYGEQSAKASTMIDQESKTENIEQEPVTKVSNGTVFLPLVMQQQQTLAIPPVFQSDIGESTAINPSSVGNNVDDITQDTATLSASRPLTKSDSYFFTDTGYQLDQYLFRHDIITTTGQLTFAINIDRYYSPLITTTALNAAGLVDPNVITTLVNNHLLPPTATLTLAIYDIDDSAISCAEVDHIYLNDQLLLEPGTNITATLSGNDQAWEKWMIEVPIGHLRFPTQLGTGGSRPSAVNEVAIDINTECSTTPWALKVDWGALSIPSPLHRPILFVHGWTGSTTDFAAFETYAKGEGIPTKLDINLQRGIKPINATSNLLKPYIDDAVLEFGTDKVNIFAHSKGGLVSRWVLHSPNYSSKVENLFTFGTPHHGNDVIILLANNYCTTLFVGTDTADCFAAADELMIDAMIHNFNYNPICQYDGTDCIVNYVKAPGVAYY